MRKKEEERTRPWGRERMGVVVEEAKTLRLFVEDEGLLLVGQRVD